ncbi:taste receptor type 2 member 40-like [Ambystoma mexicanum]|uniref:taste receptor type 2 member 40-like n=1 Tax=Ambystoma mexicanum TaxID=8296 RepID=UPI0037E97DAA
MQTYQDIPEFAYHGVFFMIGLLGNTFILSVTFTDLLQRSNDFNTPDLILSSLGALNICHLCIHFGTCICRMFFIKFYLHDDVQKTIRVLLFSLRSSSLSFTTILCIYYCVNIVNFNNSYLMRLKVRLPGLVPWLLLGSVIVSFASCLPIVFYLQIKGTDEAAFNNSVNEATNVSGQRSVNSWVHENPISINALVASFCFAMLTFSGATILTFLCIHMKKMGQNSDGFSNPRLDAYCGAMKTIASLLIVYVLLYVPQWLLMSNLAHPGTPVFLACILIISSFPALNSAVLILGNTKLKKVLTRIIHRAKGCRRVGV